MKGMSGIIRTFQTTTLRHQVELSGKYWNFSSPVGDIKSMFVPSCWENSPGLERYRGTCVHETTFKMGGNLRFVFKGVSFWAKVYVDNTLIGEHYNAYTPFECIVKNVLDETHTLRVEVSNAFSDESALHVGNDYRSWGGITRGVMLEQLRDAYIRYVHVTPFQKNGLWHAALAAQVENLSGKPMDAEVSISLAGESIRLGAVTLAAGEQKEIKGEIVCPDAQTYQLDAPKLYEVRAVLESGGTVLDDLIDRMGFREVTVSDGKILFNGKPLRIKGFNRHETHGLFGCAIPVDVMAQDIAILKDLNANAVRTCHYPNDELFLDLCDEQGLLVWEEGHARGFTLERMQNPHFRTQSLDCIREMIGAHQNHPSIFIWGCLNECASDTDYGRECYKEQLDELKRLDPSRPTTTASCHPGHEIYGEETPAPTPAAGMHDGDICLDLPDVVSFNIYPGWYVNLPADLHMKRLTRWVNQNGGTGKPFIISEIGAGAIYGFHSRTHDKWSEERQDELIGEALTAVFANGAIQGVFLWQFCDGRVDEEWAMTRPKTQNNKGVVDEFRRPKLSYETVRRLFGEIESFSS